MAAKKVKLKDNSGNKAYPVTSSACVGMSDGSGNLDSHINKITTEYNVSLFHPTEGIDGGNKYTLSMAVEKIPPGLKVAGVKVIFINIDGNVETWEYNGKGSYNKVGYSKFLDIENLLSINKQVLDTYKEDGYLKEDGTLVPSDWITYYKIPVTEGDIVRAEGMSPVSLANTANFVVYDSNGEVTHFEKTNNVDYKIQEDGFVSVTYYISDNISVRLLSLQPIIDKVEEVGNRIGDIQALWNAYYESFKVNEVYLTNSGKLIPQGGWVVYNRIPVKEGITFTASFGYVPEPSNGACVVIFGKDGDVIQSYKQGSVTYTFTEDGYLSFCQYIYVSNSYSIVNGDSIAKFIETFVNSMSYITGKLSKIENLSIELNVDAAISDSYYRDESYLNKDGTISGSGGWGTYYMVPVKKGYAFTYRSGLIPSISTATCFTAYNTDGEVIYEEKELDISYICEQDGFISFCYYIPSPYEFSLKYNTTLKDYIASQAGGGTAVKKIKWCAIGDSITSGNGNNTGASYATVAAELLGEQVELIKLGYWGQRIQNVLATSAFNAIPEDTDIVTMNLGSNDIFDYPESGWGDVDEIIVKERESLRENVSTFENLRLFFEKMRENHPSVLIYVINPIKRGDNDVAKRFNEQEKKMCDYYSIPYLDAFNESGIRYSDPVYTSDGTHPNDAGRLMIARWLVSKISFLNL